MISICAPCYNHEKFIPVFMESLLSQADGDWELIVVDDCSTDGSFGCLQEYASNDPRIRVFRNDRNRHVCETINRAMSYARGELVTLLSCDDVFLPGMFASVAETFRRRNDICALCARVRVFSDDGSACPNLEMPEDLDRFHVLRTQLFSHNTLLSPGLTVRHELLREIGGYDPMLRMVQDHEFLTRILEHGTIGVSECPTVGYRRHSGNLSRVCDSYLSAISNESVYFLSRHYLSGLKKVEDLMQVIPESTSYGEPTAELIPYFLSRFAIERGEGLNVRFAGLLALYQFMESEPIRQRLERQCGFLPKDFMMLSELPVFVQATDLARTKESLALMERSLSYRLGLALTWPLRKGYRSLVHQEG